MNRPIPPYGPPKWSPEHIDMPSPEDVERTRLLLENLQEKDAPELRTKKAEDKALTGEEGVDHPPHYAAIGKYEPIDVIEDWKLGYHSGCALKYIARYRHKGTPVKDLRKAAWYLMRLADELEKNGMEERQEV